jgi:hypothetical protein
MALMDITELALRHVIQHGMTPNDGVAMLEAFAKGDGRDIPWDEAAPRLSKELTDRIDFAGTGWMLMHEPTANLPDLPRDGKMLATGDD